MTLTRRAAYGALGGTGGAFALTGLRKTLARAGLVHETAPQQVVSRLEEFGLLDSVSPRLRDALAVAAHLGYGAGSGAVFGVLRRETGGLAVEAAVGAALGILIWGAGWSSWLPLLGVHRPPWKQQQPEVLLLVLDHAFFGMVWALIYLGLRDKFGNAKPR